MAPLANIPSPVTDLSAIQRGNVIIAHFTVPAFTTEHIAVKESLTLDLRIGVWPEHTGVETWAAAAKAAPEPTLEGNLANYKIPAAAWVGKEVVLAVRSAGSNGKESAWSNYVILPVVTPPDQPHDLKAASTPGGVRLTWRANGEHFRVLRKTGDELQYAVVAPDIREQEWTDAQAVPGSPNSYLVQTFVPLGENREAQSDLSEVKITPEVPPPAAPTGMVAVPAPATIELNWDAVTDAVGYRIYRAAAGGAFEKIADTNGIPAYSDHAVEHGKTYRYAVSALDANGREGARSEPKEVTMQ